MPRAKLNQIVYVRCVVVAVHETIDGIEYRLRPAAEPNNWAKEFTAKEDNIITMPLEERKENAK